MSLTDYVIMPGEDYKDACDAVREKTGGTEPIKSGQMGGLIRGISGGGEVVKGLCEGTPFDLKSDEVTAVNADAFAYRNDIGPFLVKTVDLPNAKTIGAKAFSTCTQLETVSLPSATDIGVDAFTQCEKLEEVVAPNVVSMGDGAFSWCDLLKSANFPKLENVPQSAFFYCKALESVNLPAAVTIGDSAFAQCDALENVVLPSATAVSDLAFSFCDSLKKVDFGAVVTIGEAVFSDCPALTAVIFRTTAGVCVATPDSLMGSPLMTGTAFVYIPAAMWDFYTMAYGDYMVLFRKIEDYPEICG